MCTLTHKHSRSHVCGFVIHTCILTRVCGLITHMCVLTHSSVYSQSQACCVPGTKLGWALWI